MLAPALLLLMIHTPDFSKALKSFVERPQPAYAYRVLPGKPVREISLTSQAWQGREWRHDILIQRPARPRGPKGLAYLVITGDRVDRVDLPFGQKLADLSGVPVATLFDVPNQPLFDKREDDLIAYSFQQFMETSDAAWPLLFPMANSAVKAMDAIVAATRGREGITRFVVTGESKRGWTTWLVGALRDPRVAGIAPVAFDNLRFAEQLHHQMVSWGHLSEMLGSYSAADLTEQTESEGGKDLIQMVDPYSYLKRIRCPIFAIRGANDRYWATDAMDLYWDRVPLPRALSVLPNEGHDFASDATYLRDLAAFPQMCLHPLRFSVSASFGGSAFQCRWSTKVESLRLWEARAPTRDLRDSRWSVVRRFKVPNRNSGSLEIEPPKPSSGFAAFFVEFRLPGGVSLTSTVQVLQESDKATE